MTATQAKGDDKILFSSLQCYKVISEKLSEKIFSSEQGDYMTEI